MSAPRAAYGLPYPTPASVAVSAAMKANHQTDTKPERLLRAALHRLGYRFRKDLRVFALGRTVRVDIAFPGESLAVFVDGCFWHQCPTHGTVPKSNRAYWVPKLRRNVERDARTTQELRQAGWTVLRVWEHVAPDSATELVIETLERLRRRGQRRAEAAGPAGPAVDLFAGAGGSTAGLKQAGFQVVGAVENDPGAAKTYVDNHDEVLLFERDIRDVTPADFRRALDLEPGELRLLNACPPCQGFSTLGSGDADEDRNDLVSVVVPFITELLPQAFVIENVPGLRGDERLARLLETARELSYAMRPYVVDAVDFGVPQRRRRLIVVGVREGSDGLLPEHLVELLPRSFDRAAKPVPEVIAVAGPIADTRDPIHRARRNSAEVLERIKSIPPNGGRFDLPKDQRLKCHDGVGRSAASPYGRLRTDEPAPTLTTRCTTPACGRFVHPTEHRGISLREAALLQTFPRRYRFFGSYQSIESQIGNAVPARLAKALGLSVKELLLRVEENG